MKKIFRFVILTVAFAAIYFCSALAAEPTLSGHSTKLLKGQKIVDTNWFYYDDIKTLEFVGAVKSYNETGDLSNCDEGASWAEYKDTIEHIIVGNNISKITGFAFDGYKSLRDIRIEPAVNQIDAGALYNCPVFTTLWINGTERIEGRFDGSKMNVLKDNFKGTAVKEIVLSPKISTFPYTVPSTLETVYASVINEDAKKFARNNSLTLIDLNDMSEVDTKVEYVNTYNPEGATVSGHSSKVLNGMTVVNTNWAYYAETKTLELVGNTKAYNETGSLENCDPEGASWAEYKDEIEHIIVGPDITKITGFGFSGYGALKDVRIAESVTQMDGGAFEKCPNLNTFWIEGRERIEGRADLSTLASVGSYFPQSMMSEMLLGEKLKSINFSAPPNLKTLYAKNITFDLKLFAESSGLKLINANDMSEVDTKVDYNEMFPGSTLAGHSSGSYNGTPIVNTYWAYYADTKTLEFSSNSTAYNETGTAGHVDSDITWTDYRAEIEHVIIGDNIVKITGGAFSNCTSLVDVRLGNKVSQIDSNAFSGCTNLTTIWRYDSERIEGRADLSKLSAFNNIINKTAIKEIVLSEKVTTVKNFLPASVMKVYSPSITDTLRADAETNFFDLVNLNNQNEVYAHYIPIDTSLPYCGSRAVFAFDEATGTLTISGAGKISDIVNYYGGGSKTSPFFSIKKNVKHIVIADTISEIGKYAFCQFGALESVALPNNGGLVIANGAFEKCVNLRTVYINGSEPIEGAADLSSISKILAWAFAEDCCFANIILPEGSAEIADSAFDSNVNLSSVYGVPGGFAESYAKEKGLKFFDISAGLPEKVHLAPPESASESETEDAGNVTDSESETAEVTEPDFTIVFHNREDGGNGSLAVKVTVLSAIAVAVIAVVLVIIMKKKKK